jgi:metallo-beta-lactamase family protein
LKLSFHGADRDVTGSCHLLECDGHRVLIDCGLYQGAQGIADQNTGPLGFEPADIDFVLLTHAHLDHCGRLPLLAKRGFHGEIIATAATRELARLVLLDAAHLQEQEILSSARRSLHHGGTGQGRESLYSLHDALNSLGSFGRTANYGQPLRIAQGIQATFVNAGHILGSASILLELDEGGRRQRVLFSGDLGSATHHVLRGPATPPKTDIVIMETTYGDRLHRPFAASVEELYQAISETFARGGNVVIPTFALERAQELLYFLREGIEQSRLPPSMRVFLDSPMAISATEVFERHPECLDFKIVALLRDDIDPFGPAGLHFVRETSDSIALNSIEGGAVIMAGPGMCTGGRVIHHLRHNLSRPESSIVFVGYAAVGTLARQIIDGASTVRIFDEQVQVRACIHTINGFSAHADQAELIAWHNATGAGRTFLVHGEENVMGVFAGKLTGTKIEMPSLNQSFEI